MILNFVLIFILMLCIFQSMYRQIEKFDHNSEIIYEIVDKLSKHFPNIKKLDFFEGDESFTLNKKKVYICIKDSKGQLYSTNVLTYVILHEYAHSICPEIGHTPLYKSIFSKVLAKAINLKLYTPDGQFPSDYCK